MHWTNVLSEYINIKSITMLQVKVFSDLRMKKEKDIQQIISLFNEGHSLRRTGRELGCSQNTVKKYLELEGIKAPCNNIIKSLKTEDDLLIGTYVGLWAGDGTHYYDRGYNLKFCCDSRNTELIMFIKEIVLRLFDKKSFLSTEERYHRTYVRFDSKFIFLFSKKYLEYNSNKTHTVCLNKPITLFSQRFLEGFVLGLTLSDGYLKSRFRFNVTSENLADNMCQILESWELHPSIYVHKRAKYGWKNLHMVSLPTKESQTLLNRLNIILSELGYDKGFSILKGYKK